jgi:prepilin peptidase CpaA
MDSLGLPLATALILVWVAACWDLRQRRIPNWLTFGGAAFGIVLHGGLAGIGGVAAATAGLAVGLGILLPGFLLRTTGAGDAKLMAAAGSLLGPQGALLAGLAGIAAGGIIAAAVALSSYAGAGAPPWARYGLMLRTLVHTGRAAYIPPAEGEVMGRRFPFAVPIALGVTAVALAAPSTLLTITAG